MRDAILRKKKIDPAEFKQVFAEVNLKVHCCRYWLLNEWECLNMAFPFWRLYYNTFGNASVTYKGKTITLDKDKMLVIPPDTAFSTQLKSSPEMPFKESIIGKRVEGSKRVNSKKIKAKADHLFIHFNLGIIPDNVEPGLYDFPATPVMKDLAYRIKKNIISNNLQIDFSTTMAIHSLINHLLMEMPQSCWKHRPIDRRVLSCLRHIEKNLGQKLTNADMAVKAHMATNSFARLFHENIHLPLQEYIRKKRIEKACNLMHHTPDSIDQIATNCGFVDRQHFSKVFKQTMNITPAHYKKHHTMDIQ